MRITAMYAKVTLYSPSGDEDGAYTLQEYIESGKKDELENSVSSIGSECAYFLKFDEKGYVSDIKVDEQWAEGAHIYDY